MEAQPDIFDQYSHLPDAAQKLVRANLQYWFQWGTTTVYEKLHGCNLNRAETFFIRNIMAVAVADQQRQTVIPFDWDEDKNSPKCEGQIFAYVRKNS